MHLYRYDARPVEFITISFRTLIFRMLDLWTFAIHLAGLYIAQYINHERAIRAKS